MRTTSTLLALLTLTITPAADAGWRWQRCAPVYYPHVQKHVVQPAVVQQQAVAVPQQVVNISNVYPNPVNSYPRGNTQYTLASAAQVYALNPDLAITAASRVADNAVSSLRSSISSGLANNAQVAEIAKIQSATQHLLAAIGSSQQPSSVMLRLTQSAAGSGYSVEQLTSDPQTQTQQLQQIQVPPVPQVGQSVIGTKCARCHGTELASPKGDLFLDAGRQVDALTIVKALDMIRQDKMPPDSPLSAQEKAAIMDEFFTLLKE